MSAQASDKSLNFSSLEKYQQSKNIPSLTEVSPIGKTWEKHRNNVDQVSDYYAKSGEDAFNEYAWRLKTCSDWLEFRLVPEQSTDILNFKLSNARFCRVRHCPVCQWRRSLMWKAKAYKVLPQVVTDYPKYRWLFITLTVRNCKIAELRENLVEINKAFKRLTELKAKPNKFIIENVGFRPSTQPTSVFSLFLGVLGVLAVRLKKLTLQPTINQLSC